jgi:S-(hydroxymethyl)glutathione dehydrogenase / alcohol dehydrogenase
MRATVARAFGEPLCIETVDIDDPGEGEIAVDVAACAICHSDIIFADGGWGGTLPAIYGHEAAGIVTRLGPGVDGFRVGDHVVATLIRSCGHCPSCNDGHPVTCGTAFYRDSHTPLRDGEGKPLTQGLRTAAFAEKIVVDASQAVTIPKGMNLDVASLLACGVITGVGAVLNTAALRSGATAAVIGTGGVGLNVIQAAALSGAARIIAIDLVPSKLETACRFGATHGLLGSDPDLKQQLRALTNGRGADYVFVTVGARAAFIQSLGLVARSGSLVLVGMPPDGVTIDIDPGFIAQDNLRVLGSKMGDSRIKVDIPKLVALHEAGKLKLDELISARYSLDRINEAMASAKAGEAVRNVIVMR